MVKKDLKDPVAWYGIFESCVNIKEMKNIIVLIVILLTLISCEKKSKAPPVVIPGPTPTYTPISANRTSFVSKFDSYATAKGITLSISVAEMDSSISLVNSLASNVLGQCNITTGGEIIIELNASIWNTWASQGRSSDMEQLIFHELGHCVLQRGHNNNTELANDSSVQVEVSLMNQYHLSPTIYERNHNFYITELFDSSATPSNEGISLYTSGSKQYVSTYASTIRQGTSYLMSLREGSEDKNIDELTIQDFKCGHE